MLTKDELTLSLPDDVLIVVTFVPEVSVTVRITNKFTTSDPVGWIQVAYNDPTVDGDSGDSGDSPSCASQENMSPDAYFDVTGECVDGVAVFDVFVYDDSAPFSGLSQSMDMGCSFLSTGSSSGKGIAYYSFMVGCSG